MKQQQIQTIEEKVNNIITDHLGDVKSLGLPINLGRIVENEGFQIQEVRFKDPDISGAYDKDKKIIYVSIEDQKARQAFTIAHELGHHFLEHQRKQDLFYRHYYRIDIEDGVAEQEANLFAASLLIPKPLLLKHWRYEKDTEILASLFGVSERAMFWRLRNLKLHS